MLAEEERLEADQKPWHALQHWLESPSATRTVTIPYAKALAKMIPPLAVRLRRDFGALLSLIRAHTMLHQATRERDDRGRLLATLDDYSSVRELVADLVSEGIEATVPKSVRRGRARRCTPARPGGPPGDRSAGGKRAPTGPLRRLPQDTLGQGSRFPEGSGRQSS